MERFIRVYDGIRSLASFGSEKYNANYNRTWYLIIQKSGVAYVISQNYGKYKAYYPDSLPPEKEFTFHIVMLLIKSVLNKDKNHCYYNKVLEKHSYR